jgi:hypothetical protein
VLVAMAISNNYFHILFLFLTTANSQNIPYHTAECWSALDSAKPQCHQSNLMSFYEFNYRRKRNSVIVYTKEN